MSGYHAYTVYWRNPETRTYERIPILQLVKSPSGDLRAQMTVQRVGEDGIGRWHTISKLWVRE